MTRKGVLTPNDPPSISLPPGDGPRHFYFHPNGRWLYSLQEEGSNIVLFDYDAEQGRLTARQTISSLPPGFAGSNFCSEILVSADGRFVYAGNRLHDSIAIFSVGPTGALTYVGRGVDPRQLSAQLQFRSHRPVPLFLQSAGRQPRRLPRGSPDGRPGLHRPLHARRQSFDHRLPRSRQDGVNSQDPRGTGIASSTDSEEFAHGVDFVIPSARLRAGSETQPKDLATERVGSLACRPDPSLRSG